MFRRFSLISFASNKAIYHGLSIFLSFYFIKAYIEDVGTEDQEKDVLRISIDMDEGVLVNSSGQDPIPAPNMGCDKEGAKLIEGGCDVYDFALHDIKAGDELLFRYWDFEARNSWEKFGIAKKE